MKENSHPKAEEYYEEMQKLYLDVNVIEIIWVKIKCGNCKKLIYSIMQLIKAILNDNRDTQSNFLETMKKNDGF